MKRSKRYKQAVALLDEDKTYSLAEAVDLIKKLPLPQFDETVEITCKLTADPKKSDQMIRGSVLLPHGTGKNIRVIVFCEPEKEAEARDAGADYVGSADLIDKIIKENWLEFDCCISTPTMMKLVSRLGKILGPRGLMPSPKTGTVTNAIPAAVKEAKTGKIDFRMDKLGGLAVGVGKVSFSAEALIENIKTFYDALIAAKPSTVKGELIKTIYMSSTMGPSLKVKL